MFVDTSGRRRRWARLVAYGVGAVGLAYTVLVGISFAGGPVGPETVLPLIEATERPAPVSPTVSPTVLAPTPDGATTSSPDASPSTGPAA